MNVEKGLWKCHAGCGEGKWPQLRALLDLDADELPEGMREEIAAENAAEQKSETAYPYHDKAGTEYIV